MTDIKKFLKSQTDKLKNHSIVFYSINIQLKWNEKEQKLKKTPLCVPAFKDIAINCSFDTSKNGTIIPLGKRYGNLIGVDVDNKNDTLDFFNNLAVDNDFDLNTLSLRTINDGMHYYFKLNQDQAEALEDFMSSTALCFTTPEHQRNIDIKYTNQVFFGPSYLNHDSKAHKYEIETDTEPAELPDYLFKEILRTHRGQIGTKKSPTKTIKKVENLKDDKKEKNDGKQMKQVIDKEKVARLRLYLDCLNVKRFDDRADWLSIGAIIYNECGSFILFDEYSKKSLKYDKKGCLDLWKSLKGDRGKKATIKKLIEFAEMDTGKNGSIFQKALVNDEVGILGILYEDGPSDLYMSYLFYSINKNNFIYDTINESWYSINEYGIYTAYKKGDTLKSRMNTCLIGVIKKEYIRLLKLIKDDIDAIDTDADKYKMLLKKFKNLVKYCCSGPSKENLLNELRLLYTIDKIYEKMDTVNPNLIGFDNGVYDLENKEFRCAHPEEYISVTTGYNYKKANTELKKKAIAILETIFPNPEELRCMLKDISLGLYGANPEETFDIWIGTGGNGKGLLRDIGVV
jgi:hypothetical protein